MTCSEFYFKDKCQRDSSYFPPFVCIWSLFIAKKPRLLESIEPETPKEAEHRQRGGGLRFASLLWGPLCLHIPKVQVGHFFLDFFLQSILESPALGRRELAVRERVAKPQRDRVR